MAGGAVSIAQNKNERRVGSSSPVYPRKTSSSMGIPPHSETLIRGLNALRCANLLFDVTLIVENRTFKAHRVVLAACSDYFCAMFTDPMRESRQSEIKLNGVTARGIEVLLEYAYTSKLELDRNNVQDVLSVSTHVQMNSVIDACSNFLESQIDLENCVGIAALADLYSLDALKKKSYRYMCSRLEEFAQTPDLYSLSFDQLEYILTCNYPLDCAEERVLQIAIEYCLEAEIKPELARRIFSKIQFSQFNTRTLDAIKYQLMDDYIPDEVKQLFLMSDTFIGYYRQVLSAEIFKQDQPQGNLHSQQDDPIPSNALINTRGMEMALVKIGGFETNGLTNQISCFLPSKGKWEKLTVIPHIDQCNYGTAILNNDLYVVGGSYDVCLKEYIHPFGFRYCATKNSWKTIAPIQADRCRFSLNSMGNNFLYAVGGVCEFNEYDDNTDNWANNIEASNCERYNASVDRWEYLPPLSENRSQHAGVVIGEKLYISGGIDRHLVLPSLWCFDSKTNKWTKLRNMPTPRADHVLIAFGNCIYACGGWYEDLMTETRELAENIDVYDIESNEWRTETRNPTPKYYPGVAAIKRKIYFAGGLLSSATINRATAAVQCYDLDTKEWSYNSDWEYPKEVWECTCASFYVPRERDDFDFSWGRSRSSSCAH